MNAEHEQKSFTFNLDQELLLRFINNIPGTFIVTSPDMSIRHVNPAFEKLTGFSLAEVAGTRAPYPWWPEERRGEYLTELKAILEGRKQKSEWLFRTREGKDFWVTASVSAVKENGKTKYVLASWFDITCYKDQERAFLNEISKTKEIQLNLADGVLHKLHPPLISIKSYISALLKTEPPWNTDEKSKILKNADREVDRLQLLIDDLMTIVLIETGRLKLNQKRYRITELLGPVQPQLERLAASHQLKINIIPWLPAVYIDKMRISQALENMVEYAARFSPAGSPIDIEAKLAGDWAVISVENREGIPPEDLEKVFDRSYGLEGNSQELAGAGMGLAIIKGIVEAHGGKLRVEHLPGKGSKISFSIPIIREA